MKKSIGIGIDGMESYLLDQIWSIKTKMAKMTENRFDYNIPKSAGKMANSADRSMMVIRNQSNESKKSKESSLRQAKLYKIAYFFSVAMPMSGFLDVRRLPRKDFQRQSREPEYGLSKIWIL